MDISGWFWFQCTRLDNQVTKRVSQIWRVSSSLNAGMIITAKYTPIAMLSVLVIAAFGLISLDISPAQRFWSVASAIVSALVIRVLHEPVSRITARDRPFDTEPFEPLLDHDAGDSFPSNHAGGAFALAIGASHLPSFHVILLCLAIALSVSRIYCGLHHFSDVFTGALGGVTVGLVFADIQVILHLV